MRLAGAMRTSRAQTPSLAHPELPDPRWGPRFDLGRMRPSSLTRWLAPPAPNPIAHQTAPLIAGDDPVMAADAREGSINLRRVVDVASTVALPRRPVDACFARLAPRPDQASAAKLSGRLQVA